ncbi:unnamed protein product [Lampetra fluviatilis]
MGPTLQRHPFSGLVDSAAGEAGRRCAARSKARADPTSAGDESGLHLHCAAGFRRSPGLAHVLDSLVRVSRRVGWVADPHRGPRAPAVGGTPAAERRAVVGDALGTVRTGLRTRRGAGHPGPATAAGDAFPRTPPKSGAGAVAVSLPRSQGGRTPSHQGPVGGTKPPARRPHGDPGRPKKPVAAHHQRGGSAPGAGRLHRAPRSTRRTRPPRAAGSMATVNPFIRHQRPALERHG